MRSLYIYEIAKRYAKFRAEVYLVYLNEDVRELTTGKKRKRNKLK